MTGYPATGDARRLFLASTSAPACAATFAPRATVNSALPSRIIESTSWKWRQTYNETDLSENSIVVLGCCHFFTTETLDGIIGMSEVYKIDENGEYTGLQSLVGTFHVDSETFALTINQALIDEMSNYFLVRGQERQQKLGKSIEKLHHKLDLNRQKIVADIQKAVIEYIGKLQHSKEDEISNFLKEAYAQASLIRTAMEHFRHNAAERNEPASKIHDTAVHASPEISLDAQLASMTLAPMYPIIPRDKRVNLDGHAAELKANYVILSDLFYCATKLCKQPFASASLLSAAIDHILSLLRKEWYEEVTAAELAAIKNAIVSSRNDITTHSGHWHNCENGHPLAIGEYGMAMEEARCPKCGAIVGGQPHTLAEGVTRATGMER
ncbi:hypothetical protein QTJ16_002131 [Diplocarpon rosae]|uniref:RZ-type domain-containing protein n=1 Tax=Diplocarpon rosae TaxID=946125 RepID=A0AAD9WG93_9HELO|nr:hypothetical protein QTJ16_002131 [Diplocarpon rosae]